ncbi:MAG: adenylosuccinate lyase [Clostridia bacterium]|nr:adenylosuccinate lyase [Clostridia bacterium]
MHDIYESPFNKRYASPEMSYLFSDDNKFRTWRKLWVALAEAEKEFGLPITEEQIAEMKKYQNEINYEVAEENEKKFKHDVMSHIHAYGAQCPEAMPIIHLGVTSCFVGDNTDLLIMLDALKVVKKKLVAVMQKLSEFALNYKDMPTLGFTHFQPAQLTTVGKRACLWLHELYLDYEELNFVLENIKLRGVKGTTGTQASFMDLLNNDSEKVKALEARVCEKIGVKEVYPITGQTYSRKVDARVLNVLSAISQSAYKFANDLRMLQSLKELEEPFEKKQIGSSAMPYKRNPMRSERLCSLARYVMVDSLNPALTASTQWFERTLDDSANRRISISEAFLAVDSLLMIYLNIVSNIVVYPKVIEKHVREELPFMATENIMMEAVKRGGNRQELHEKIRVHSMEAGRQVKEFGLPNDLLERIKADSSFGLKEEDMAEILEPKKYIGRSADQVTEFIREYIKPILEKEEIYEGSSEMKV